ncbi:hypothetical protein DL96DRAFT_1790665 [Flagelloscypha sp. PMI_526]|nr:hypothetical protein DL96DRAFT_1790665 [Flagelloscypha sp. PMI_526]
MHVDSHHIHHMDIFEPPLKRRKLDEVIWSTLDIEISLRQRLLGNIHSKLEWARLLKETLEQDSGSHPSGQFQQSATEAFLVTEESCRQFLHPPPIPPVARPRTRPTRENRIQSTTERKFLYIRSSKLDHLAEQEQESIFLLACPACQRSNFTNLQGLYNHGRLTHAISWGTHDECVKACIIPAIPEVNLLEGHEIIPSAGGFRPDIQGLFKQALLQDAQGSDSITTAQLGLHADMPIIAPLLGRTPKPRQIRIFDEEAVDIISPSPLPRNTTSSPRAIRGPRLEDRSGSTSSFSQIAASSSALGTSSNTNTHGFDLTSNLQHEGSRFHLRIRIILADRSLWIKDAQVHKWMVSVDSASYSKHISTALERMVVTSASPHFHFEPLSQSGPPFVVVGRATKPFLARVELVFNGTMHSGGQDLQHRVFEQWVDLEPTHSGSAALGEEQIIDVDLDQKTILLPTPLHYTPINSRVLWDRETIPTPDERPKPVSSNWETILESFLAQVPSTKQDIKGRAVRRHVHYTLMPTRRQLLEAPIGRRKAIEWARARALHDLYTSQASNVAADDFIPLTPADVYSWMEDKEHFLRPPKPTPPPQPEIVQTWCSICGIPPNLHPIVKLENDSEWRSRGQPTLIPFGPRSRRRYLPFVAKDLLEVSDPSIILYVHGLIQRRASSSPSPFSASLLPLDQLGTDSAAVETTLAPAALVALILRPLISGLVRRGLNIMSHDTLLFPSETRKALARNTRMFTQTHILRAIACEHPSTPLVTLVHRVRPPPPPPPPPPQTPMTVQAQNPTSTTTGLLLKLEPE